MISWYDDKDLKICFYPNPQIGIRYVLPSMSEIEKKSVKKYPFINKLLLTVYISDKSNKKEYIFEIPKGYCFDGASIPRFFWRIIGSNSDNKFLVAAMVHDYMCENHNVIGYDRELSTKIFNALLEVSGVKNIKRFFMKNSVDIFQKLFCHW